MISFIIVNYRSRDVLLECLNDLEKIDNAHKCEVIVVNNDRKNLDLNNTVFSRIKVCEINENVGYAAANNVGLEHVKEPYICFLNPDTHSFSKNLASITKLIDEKTIASPKILTSKNTPQEWSVGHYPSLRNIIINNLGIHKRLWNSENVTEVDWVSGAALFVSRELIASMNGFDENYFLYFEDVDLCKRLRNNSGKILYIPEYSVVHISGKSSKKARKKQKKCYYTSQDKYIKKHHGFLEYCLLRALRIFHKS